MNDNDVIAQWKQEEEAVRVRLRPTNAPAPTLQPFALSGLDTLNAIFSGELPPPPIGETLDFVPIRMAHGQAVFQGRPLQRHYNPLGTVHGGWFATLLDSAVGCAIHTTLAAGRGYTTLELKVNLVRALTDAVPLVRAEGQVIHVGRQTGTAEGRIVGPDGKLYAHATTTCLIFDLPS
ncbi:PaaI family thioesterase [Hydrogenophaga soli]